ncbi:MAG TPA: FecR family protein [Pyrinomonadaceae bacterium]
MNARHEGIKLWPHLTLVFLVCAALGGVAAALWMRHEPKAEALALPHAARVERVDGEVGLSRDLDAAAGDESDWVELTPNTPLTTGDRLYAREDSRAALAFTGRNYATVDPDSALDVVSLSDRRTQLALRRGSAVFDVGALAPGELFEVATPYGAVDFREPGLYQVGYNDDGSAFVSVLSGLAQVVGLAGSGQISKGEMLTLLGQTAAQVALSRLSPDYAGGLVDDYYGYRYPDSYDGRYSDYDAYLNDPDYYDPYDRNASYRYVPATVPGAYDLDEYGDWQNVNGYGYAWSPRVEQGWAPYRDGHWTMDDPYGLTWVSNEPWGYAPYHYGRWVSAGDRWYWVPDAADTQPAYAPALVAFLPATGADEIGWVPLAPGEQYAPAYYDANWQPHYVGDNYYAPERAVNVGAPGGLTVVPFEDFGRPVERDRLARFDPRAFEGVRPLGDPLSHAVLRQMSLTHARANERRGFTLPPGLAKKLDDTQVYASAPPPRLRGDGNDVARRFRVEPVPEKQKREKLKFNDERQQPVQAAPLRGFEQARGRSRDLRREEKAGQRAARGRDPLARPVSPEAERVSARSEERARGERAAQARQAQAADERQQRAAAHQQQRFEAQRQAEAHAQAQRQAAQQQRAQHAAQRAQQQQEMMRARQQQQQQQRVRAERPQHQPQQQRPAAQAPPGQSRKQQAPAGGPPHGGGGGGGGKGQGHGGGKGKGKP